ncbi:hypothetical protein D5272_06445 [bacterium D16-76]|nr:hypothetical protein [bacterium D16-76]
MRKGIKKQFWLSEKDAADLKRKAQRCGVTEISVIRQLLHGYEPREKYDGHCHVKVDIYFTGVGMIDVPTEQEIQKLMDELQPKEATRIPA